MKKYILPATLAAISALAVCLFVLCRGRKSEKKQ